MYAHNGDGQGYPAFSVGSYSSGAAGVHGLKARASYGAPTRQSPGIGTAR